MKVGQAGDESGLASGLVGIEVGQAERSAIGARLAHIRASASQRDHAAALGIPLRTYQNYERGEREPDLRVLLALLHAGWNANWLLTGEGPAHMADLAGGTGLTSQDLSPADLSMAIQLANEKIARDGKAPTPEQYGTFVLAIYQVLKGGLAEAQVLEFPSG